jgi:hypothetical protein
LAERKKKTVAQTKAAQAETVNSIKGFNRDLTCMGYKFEPGKTFEHAGTVRCCSSGFHACKVEAHPLEVFGYYAPGTSRYFEVVQSGPFDSNDDVKIASAKITIGLELSISELTRRAIEWVFSRAKPEKGSSATGDAGAASATGDRGAASATGDVERRARLATLERRARLATLERRARLATLERRARLATLERRARLATLERRARLAFVERRARLATLERRARLATLERRARLATLERRARLATLERRARLATLERRARLASVERRARLAFVERRARLATLERRARLATLERRARLAFVERRARLVAKARSGKAGCAVFAVERDRLEDHSVACGIIGQDGLGRHLVQCAWAASWSS